MNTNATLENYPDIMTAKDLQSFLHISRSGVYSLLNDHDFPTLHIGKRKMVVKSDLIRWMRSHTDT